MNRPAAGRILVMRYRFIGDTLLTVPFLRNLRAAYPEAQIDMLVGPGSGEVLSACPYLDERLVFDTTRKHRYENTGDHPPTSFWAYARLLKHRQYDLAFVLKRSFSSAALALLAGIPRRVGFNTEGRGLLLTDRAPYDPTQPEVESFLSVLSCVDIPVTDRHLEAWWPPADGARTAEALAPYTGTNWLLHLSASNPGKQWPAAHAAELAQRLLNDDPQLTLHALGDARDQPVYETLRQALSPSLADRLISWCGRWTLSESLAFISQLDGAVGVDSGTLHMAAACGVPVVALFGPMDARKWAPPGARVIKTELACQPCGLKRPCRFDFECMRALTPQEVLTACHTHLRP
ncbi:MAG: lipopolysaccharide heptosyltransferase II [Candidatus Melainabacteria bacterium]